MAEFNFPWRQVSSDNSTSLTITSNGDGNGVAKLYFKISAPLTLTLDGTARFYSDSNGTLDESTTFEATNVGSYISRYVRCPSGSATLTFSNRYNLLEAGSATSTSTGLGFWQYVIEYYSNAPILNYTNWNFPNCTILSTIGGIVTGTINLSTFSDSLVKLLASGIYINGDLSDIGSNCELISSNTGTITGNLSSIGSSMIYFNISGSNTITGDISNLPSSMSEFNISGNNTVYGDIINLPSNINNISISGNNTISGNITNLPSTLISVSIYGLNTVTGDIANFKNGIETILIYGSNTLYGNIDNLEDTITLFKISGNNTISGNVANLPSLITYISIIGNNTVTGDIGSIPNQISSFEIFGNNTLYGDIGNLPVSVTKISITGSNTISGSIENISSAVYYFYIIGNNTISGSFNSTTYSKTAITTFYITGNNTISGDLYYAPQNVATFVLTGNNTVSSYTSGRTWRYGMIRLTCDPSSGGLDSTEIDNLLIDLAVGTWSTTGIISLRGTNAIRTSASDAAVSTLTSKSVDIYLNT